MFPYWRLRDFEKAFGNLEWNVLQGILKHLNFGLHFCNMLSILNVEIQSTVTKLDLFQNGFHFQEQPDRQGPWVLFYF